MCNEKRNRDVSLATRLDDGRLLYLHPFTPNLRGQGVSPRLPHDHKASKEAINAEITCAYWVPVSECAK